MKRIVAIASGKGGVGKSTIAANLATYLANNPVTGSTNPLKIALIDIDFYGPSIPVLMGSGSKNSEISINPDNELIIPAFAHAVKYISIALFLKNDDDPIIWRGPRFAKAINQLFNEVDWGDIDICIVDLPPGTGDAQLSLAQVVKLDGVVMITTPQEVSLSDVRRAVKMFEQVKVPILGVVENMAGFKTPDGKVTNIFGEGGGKKLSEQYNLNFFGSIPIDIAICEGADKGEPIVNNPDSEITAIYKKIAEMLATQLENTSTTEVKIEN